MKHPQSRRPHGAIPFRVKAGALAIVAALAGLVSAPAFAVEPTAAVKQYSISAGNLGDVLAQYAASAGVQLVVDPALVERARTSAGLKGSYSVPAGFAALLAGSGLEAFRRGDGSFGLRVAPVMPEAAKREDAILQAVEVTGRSETETFSDFTFSVTKTQTHILDIPQSISAVTKEVIQDQGLLRLNSIAPYVAGVNEFSVYDDLTIRGFRNSDDRRVNGMRTYNNFWSQPSIAHLERVEVVKGPAAATFGDASPGGVVNMVTKKPLMESRREVQAMLGSFDKKYVAADLTGPLNDAKTVLYRLNVAGENSESFRNEVFNKSITVAPSFTFLPREGTRINLDVVYTDLKTILDRGQPNIRNAGRLGIVPIEVSVTQPGDRLNSQNLTANLTLDQRLNDQWSLVLSHMHNDYDERMNEHGLNSYITDSVIDLYFNDRFKDATVDTTSAYVTSKLTTGRLQHRLVLGLDHIVREDSTKNRWAENFGSFDLLNPVYAQRDTTAYVFYPFETYGGKTTTDALYISDQISFGAWELLAGLRYDRYKTAGDENGVATPSTSGSRVSPRLGLVYKLDESRSVYGSWLTGFEPPDSWMNSSTYGGPFKPQDSELFEIGYKQLAFDGRLLITGSLYQLDKNNAVVYANDLNNPDLYIQRGQERARGFELEAAGRVTDRISLIANYAYNDAKITKDTDPANVGKTKENAPRHSATLWGRYDFTSGWGVGAGLTHVSQRETFASNLQLPAYTVWNAGIFYGTPATDVSLTVQNLADEEHWTGGYNFGRVFPGTPRSINLNIKHRF